VKVSEEIPTSESSDQSGATKGGITSQHWGWYVVVLLLLCEYGLFRQQMLREVTWAYPSGFDQTAYLIQAYVDYERIISAGFLSGLKASLLAPSATGIMLQTQAALLFLMVGPNRLTALTLSFLYFALFQSVLVYTLNWLTGRWSVAFTGLGLFLVSTSRFAVFGGGLADFRIDSTAASLYGITLCLAIRSRSFRSRRWALICGAAATLLVLFRFVSITYVLGLLGSFIAYLIIQALRHTKDSSIIPRIRRQAYGIATAMLPIACGATPFLVLNRRALYDYYIVGHVLGKENQIRAAEFGAVGFYNFYFYYPTSLCKDHLGTSFIGLGLLILAVFVACRLFAALRHSSSDCKGLLSDSFALSFLALLVPLALFTLDVSKSPIVGSILVIPVVWLVLLGGLWISGLVKGTAVTPVWCIALGATAMLVLMAGLGSEFAMSAKQLRGTLNREEEEHLLDAYDRIGAYCTTLGLKTTRVAVDRILDYFCGPTVPVMTYERSRTPLAFEFVLSKSMYPVGRQEALDAIKSSDIAIITTNIVPADEASPYPFTKSMIAIQGDLKATAAAGMVPLSKLTFDGRDLTVFVRPGVKLDGDNGGWLTSAGATLRAPAIVLKRYPYIVLEGGTMLGELLAGKLHVDARMLTADAPRSLPTLVSPITTTYMIAIDLRGQPLQSVRNDGSVDITLSFDRYFVPKERGINSDYRQLVIMKPASVRVTDQIDMTKFER